MLSYLAPGARLVAVRITAGSIGTQDLQLVSQPARDEQGDVITIRLKQTSRIVGRVRNHKGEPVAGQVVEVWFRGTLWLDPSPVAFESGPVRTKEDGSFQTPDNLFVGSQYRLVARTPGKETNLSDWITIGDKPRVLLPLLQLPLRTVSGRVVDRQGKPLAAVEVFQSGDGPVRTSTTTDALGRFALAGFRQGPVFLFAQGEGYRFSGRLIKPEDRDITFELTRTSERPSREMRMLPDVIPLEESRTFARRLIEPYLEDPEHTREAIMSRTLRLLAATDPIGVLQRLDHLEPAAPRVKEGIKVSIVAA